MYVAFNFYWKIKGRVPCERDVVHPSSQWSAISVAVQLARIWERHATLGLIPRISVTDTILCPYQESKTSEMSLHYLRAT